MKHILLGMAFCGLFNITHAMTPQKDVKAGKERTEIVLFAHDEFGGAMHAKAISTVVVPLTPSASPKSQTTATPGHTPADSQNNSVQPSPATSPKKLVTFNAQVQEVAALPKPRPVHARSHSAPVVAGAAVAACAHAGDKPNEPKKLVTFKEKDTIVPVPKGLRIQTEFAAPEVVGAAAAACAHADDKPSDEPKK